MPVTTRPSPEVKGKHRGLEAVLESTMYTRPLFDATAKECADFKHGKDQEDEDAWIWNGGRPSFVKEPPPRRAVHLLRSSCDDDDGRPEQPYVIPYGNGFVTGLIRAFNQDLDLTIRPDDVWLAILLQFSNYVNGNAETLRHQFVAHEGKKELVLDKTPLPFHAIGTDEITDGFTALIHENVVDETLREWMLPSFSTSTATDQQIASFTMMGTLKQYFEYIMCFGCGLPSVTLLGEREDWEMIQRRLDKLATYGSEPAQWVTLLRPVVRHMILTFDEPDSDRVKRFWLQVAQEAGSEGSGHGIKTLTGWITAFTYWDDKGMRIREYQDSDVEDRTRGDRQSLAQIKSSPYDPGRQDMSELVKRLRASVERKRLVLDGVTYPFISPSSIPNGIVTVPIKLQMGSFSCTTTVLAGSVGMLLSEDKTAVRPLSSWWMALDLDHPDNKEMNEADMPLVHECTKYCTA